MKAMVVLSGGQDSTTCLFRACELFEEVHAVTFDYGQRHSIEISSAIKVAQMANVASHEIIKLPDLLKSTSPLTSDTELEQYENYQQMDKVIGDRIEKTFVPMRNTLFLTIAANRAAVLGCTVLVTGVCAEDNANYPDCTQQFIDSFGRMLAISLGGDDMDIVSGNCIELFTPLINYTKADTVRMAFETPGCWEALAYTHTSYDGKYPPTDMNHANVLRAHGFEEAGLPDPLVIRAYHEGLMDLPDTPNYDAFKATGKWI